ncbi:hypothetical protein [Rickettsia tamurae]|nr:hypothetical protein [Rickettsia tamurae]
MTRIVSFIFWFILNVTPWLDHATGSRKTTCYIATFTGSRGQATG